MVNASSEFDEWAISSASIKLLFTAASFFAVTFLHGLFVAFLRGISRLGSVFGVKVLQ